MLRKAQKNITEKNNDIIFEGIDLHYHNSH